MVVNCEQVWREVSNYVDGEVDVKVRAAMDEHFRGCARCRSVLGGMRNVVTLYGDERMLEVPAGFGSRLEKRLAQSARGARTAWPTWSTWLVPVAALLVFAGGLRLANSLTSSPRLKSEHAQPGKNIPPDMAVLVSADARVFHAAGCGFIHNKDKVRSLTAKEAMAEGYVPCLRCMRKYLDVASARSPSAITATAAHEAEEEELRAEGR